MRIAIVGGSGFLGSALYGDLRDELQGDVTVFDKAASPEIPQEDFVRLDALDGGATRRALAGFDVVFNRVGFKGPAPSFQEPWTAYRLNLVTTLNVLEAAAAGSVEQVVLDSTESVFGPGDRAPFTHDQAPHPGSIYGATKRSAEVYASYVQRVADLDVAVLRYPRVVTPGAPNVLSTLNRKVLDREDITITAGGRKRFDIVHLSDVIVWNKWLIENRLSGILHVSPGFATDPAELVREFSKVHHGDDSAVEVNVKDEATETDELLPDLAILDSAWSQKKTGLRLEYDTLSTFIEDWT